MKAQILKLAGVKTEAEFYKKFPTEEAFMKKHGKKLKKADNGQSLIPGLGGYGGLNSGITKQNDGTYYSALEDKSYKSDVAEEQIKSSNYASSATAAKPTNLENAGMQLVSQAGNIVSAIQEIGENKKKRKRDQMYGDVTAIQAQAAASTPVMDQRRENRQFMQGFTASPLGRGTNYLAQDGASIGGNPTEIQNMYNPYDLYTDLGYEPMDDSNNEEYKQGGKIKKAQSGFNLDQYSQIGGGLGGMLGSKMSGGKGKIGPGSKIGSAVGAVAGSFIPIPAVGTFLGATVGGWAGGLFDGPEQRREALAQERLETNRNNATINSSASNFRQGKGKAFMEDGGWVSNDWQPQVITKFGDLDVSEVHSFAADGMPQYRAGGHLKEYTPPSEYAMYTGRDLPYQMEDGGQLAMGGDLEVSQGSIKVLATNPELKNGGEIVEFVGPSHEQTGKLGVKGMPMRYGNSNVEVEGKETGYTDDKGAFHVFGNMPISKFAAEQIGDKKFANMKYKNFGKEIGLDQKKQNKIIEKSTLAIADLDMDDPYEAISAKSYELNKKAAEKKTAINAAMLNKGAEIQSAILDTAEENKLDPSALAQYKIKKLNKKEYAAEFGAKLKIAKNGMKMDVGGKSYTNKFKEFEDYVNAKLKQDYRNKSVTYKIAPLTGGIYNQHGGRDVSSQASIYKKGYSQTPVSLHNYNAARDYRIYQKDYMDGKWVELDPSAYADMYADVLWPAAEELGMYHVGDRDPKTKDTNWDPAHIGLAKEGQGTAYKELAQKYPDIFNDPVSKKTVDWITKNKGSDTTVAKHFKLLQEAKPGSMAVKSVVDNVTEALKKVTPSFSSTEWAAKAVGEFLEATNSMNDAMITPNKAKGMINPPSFKFRPDAEEETGDIVPIDSKGAPVTNYKVRPKGEPKGAIVQTSPTTAVVKPNAIKDSWADDGSKWWKPILGVPQDFSDGRENLLIPNRPATPAGDSWDQDADGSNIWAPKLGIPTSFPNAKTSTSLLGKDYDPGYDEQPFYKVRTQMDYKPSEPLTEKRTVVEGPQSNQLQPVNNIPAKPVVKAKGKGKGSAAAVNPAKPLMTPQTRKVAGEDYMTNGSLPPEETQQGVSNPAMLQSIVPELAPSAALNLQPMGQSSSSSSNTAGAQGGGNSRWNNILNTALSNVAPFLRPTNQEDLDPAQLAGEMFALANNEVEPVYAQTYQPMLTQTSNISYQDQLNEITAQSRAAERMMQGNPAAQSNLFAQAAEAKNKVLGEQFRANQAEQMRVLETNRQALNDAQLKNLAIFDTQYQRQSQARSNTKAQTMAALNSISDKLAKNKLENRTLGVYENMYNYRFGPQGQAYNVNAPQNFNMPNVGIGASDADQLLANLDKQRELIEAAKSKASATKKTNGGIVKAINSL
jgi:hypothetical protein